MATEQGESQPELETESSSILPAPLASSSIDLVVVYEPVRQEITADFICLTTAPAKTLFPLIASIALTPTTPESSTMVMPQQSSPHHHEYYQ